MRRLSLIRVVKRVGMAAAMLLMPSLAWAQPNTDVADGHTLYDSKCSGCHSLDQNRIGPKHRGVIGRKVASVPDFDYSPAIKMLGGTWTPARVDQWLQGPQAMAPGARMFFQISDPTQRKLIIAYLTANSPPPAGD